LFTKPRGGSSGILSTVENDLDELIALEDLSQMVI